MKKILFAMVALLGFAACDFNEPSVEPKLQLSVDNAEIYANGEQTATFTVKDWEGSVVEDATIHFADSHEALAGKTFKTKYAGEYEFYAERGAQKSDILKVIAKEVTDATKVVTLSVSPAELGVGETATFSVDCNGEDVTADAVVYSADDSIVIEGEEKSVSFAAAGEYTFYALYDGVKSNNVVVVFTAREPDNRELVLTATPATIVADGVEKAVFSLTDDGAEVSDFELFSAADNQLLDIHEFATTEPGVYEFYAKLDGLKSNTVSVTARMNIIEEEKPITIEASTTTIKANGVDNVSFMVLQDGANVTSQSVIYVNGGVLNGSKFSTTTPGEYVVYAEKGEQKSNSLTITAEEVAATGKTIVFADGVTLTSGWYDVNKKGQGDNGDINMCWAAASANIIQWFQDRYVAAGNTLPASAVNGVGTTTYTNYGPYELELMSMFHSEWDNSRGGHPEQAVPWYFEGNLNGGEYASAGSQAVPLTSGGYWKSIWSSEVLPTMYRGYESNVGYATCYNNYMSWGNGTSYEGVERLKVVSDIIVEAFDHGMAALVVSLAANLSSVHHSTTLWGYEIDNATGLITRLWITDSDDLISEPKTQLLNEYRVSVADGKSHIKLEGDTRYGACYIVSIHPISGYNSAE